MAVLPADGAAKPAAHPPAILAGTLTLYQLYDIGDAINLDLAQACLAEPGARRRAPVPARQSESIQIAQPPLRIEIGATSAALGGLAFAGRLRASIYDLGAVSLALELPLPGPLDWPAIADLLAAAQSLSPALAGRFSVALDELEALIRPAIDRPQRSPLVEDYSVLMVERLAQQALAAALAEHPIVQAALLGERRPLSPGAARLVSSLSYYPEDLALLSWNGALLIDPDPLAAATAADLVEFANVELLILRSYDAQLDDQLPQMYRRIGAAQRRFALPLVRPYSHLLHDLQRLFADVTEVTERVDNAFKVTDDVYWNRLYSAMLGVLRVQTWRDGVDHKLELLRETYGMLHDQADAERANALEWVIVILILVELIVALLGR
ncbi:MAG: hypothetical protein IPO81_29550 [Kouleothrix sp.]|nr:hypothetical protein [Kouleothrix sp.]